MITNTENRFRHRRRWGYGLAVLLAAAATGGATVPEEGVPFSRLPAAVRQAAGVYNPLPSAETDNPFGLFAHNELPPVELVRLLADMGLGHARLPQSSPAKVIPLATARGLDLIIFSGLPDSPKRFAALKAGGNNAHLRWLETSGDEPNNNGVSPKAFVERMRKAADILAKSGLKSELIADDLGDEHTLAYFKACLGEGLAETVNYASYGYFMWGREKQLYFGMKAAADTAGIKLFLSPLQQFGNGGSGIYKLQMNLIEMAYLGAPFVNLYKFIDWCGQFGLLRMDGMLTDNYAGLQVLCQFFGRDLSPAPKLPVVVTFHATPPPTPAWKRRLARLGGSWPPETTTGDGRTVKSPRLWLRPFRNRNRLLLTYYMGSGQTLKWYDTAPSGCRVDMRIGSTEYAYPVAIDLVTGRLADLPYRLTDDGIEIRDVPVDWYARALLLLRRQPKLETTAAAAPPPSSAWRTLKSTALPGDWVTAVLPADDGGAWIGYCPLQSGTTAVARVDAADRLSPLPVRTTVPGTDKPERIGPGQRVIGFARLDGWIYVGMRGHYFRFRPGEMTISQSLPPPDAARFRPREISGLNVARKAVWFASLGTLREGNVEQGAGAARFDPTNGTWKTFTHARDNELTGGRAARGWGGRLTGITAVDGGVWVSAMGQRPSFFDGSAWHQPPSGPPWTWCIAAAGRTAWMGGNNGAVYAGCDLTTAADEDLMELLAAGRDGAPQDAAEALITAADDKDAEIPVTFEREFSFRTYPAAVTGLRGRVTHIAAFAGRVWCTTRYQGAAMLDSKRKAWTSWKPGENGFPTAMVEGICPTRDGAWVWTWGGGIASWDQRSGQWHTVTRQDGLADNRVSVVAEGADGTVWAGTFRGLSVRRPAATGLEPRKDTK